MPHSLVLNLLPATPIPPGYLTGKHLHALFLTLVSSVDRALGEIATTRPTAVLPIASRSELPPTYQSHPCPIAFAASIAPSPLTLP
ncbi:MAG: hypothetical protein RBJ76_00960 [Stenomitos frigidus ULC029]